MKKRFSLFMALMLTLSVPFSGITPAAFAAGENRSLNRADIKKDPRGTVMAGEFINCASIEPPKAAPLINNKGMSGLDSRIHLHNMNDSSGYKSELSGKKGALTFAFSQTEALGYMYIWNYNVYGELENGMKRVKIQYSFDKKSWHNLGGGEFELAKALQSENDQYGGNAANNLNDGRRTPIDFGGLPAKYVRIIPLDNYGGDSYGLSEVRFFRFKTRPDKGSLISATARAPLADSNPADIANGFGLSDLTSENALHGCLPETMWLSEKPADKSFVVINLDGTYPVDKMCVWNYNEAGKTDCGMKKVKIEYTTRRPYMDSDKGINYANGEWTSLGEYTLPQGTGDSGMPCSLTVDFKNVQAQHIRITPLDNYGGSGYGLSAVRVFAGNGWAVEPSRDWSGLFSCEGSFDYQTSGVNKRDKVGWLAADGIYTLNMNGADRSGSFGPEAKTTFLFSDTLIGNFYNYGGLKGRYGKNMNYQGLKNNTFATLLGDKPDPRSFQFYLNPGDSSSSILGDGNWAQELVRVNDKMYAWSFGHDSNWAATKYMFNTFDINSAGLPDFNTAPIAENSDFLTEFTQDGINYRIEFSGAVMDNTESGGATPNPDGYIYIYGLKSYNNGIILLKFPVVARVKPESFKNLSEWRYYDGNGWVDDIKKCAGIDGGDGMVSSEFSVSYMESGAFAGKYVMTFTNFTMSTMLAVGVSDTPYGPFNNASGKLSIYDCPQALAIKEENGDAGIYTYNAKAHPNLSADGELLISYNLNSRNFDERSSFEFLHPEFVTLFDVKESAAVTAETFCSDGENLALSEHAKADSDFNESEAVNAVDGDINTAWVSGAEVDRHNGNSVGPITFTLSFDNEITADKLVLGWGEGQGKKSDDGYKAEYSPDGVNWSELPAVYHYGTNKKYGGIISSADILRFDKIKARCFKITIFKSQNLNSPVLREAEVYNTQLKTAPVKEAFIPEPVSADAIGEIDIDYSEILRLLTEIKAENPLKPQYTPESYDTFEQALMSAQKMYDDEAAENQAQADEAAAALKKAYEELEKLPASPDKPPVTVKNGWVWENSAEYYYKNGVLQKNVWVTTGNKTFRTDKNGAKIKGNKWIKIKANRFRLNKGALLKNRIFKVGKRSYFAKKSGAVSRNAWIKYKKKWYRSDKTGALYRNKTKKIGGKKYKFNKKCVCINKGKAKKR